MRHNFALRQYFLARFFLYHICSSRNVHFWGFWVTKWVVAVFGEGDTRSQIRNLTPIPNSVIWDWSQISELGSGVTLPKHRHHAFCHSKTSKMNVSWWADVVQKNRAKKYCLRAKLRLTEEVFFCTNYSHDWRNSTCRVSPIWCEILQSVEFRQSSKFPVF